VKRIIVAAGLLLAVLACVPQPAKPRDVIARGTVTFVGDNGAESAPFTFGTDSVVLQPDRFKNTYDRVEPIAEGEDRRFAQVRGGNYLLREGIFFLESTESSVDLSFADAGRRDRKIALTSAQLRLELTGLDWEQVGNNESTLLLYSAGARAYDFAPELRGTPPTPGSVALTSNLSYTEAISPGLLEAAKSDRLFVTQFSPLLAPNLNGSYSGVVRAASLSGLTFSAAGTSTVRATLGPLPARDVDFTFNHSEFNFRSEAGGGDTPPSYQIIISACPPLTTPHSALTPELVFFVYGSTSTSFTSTIEWGNPYPADWTEVADTRVAFFNPAGSSSFAAFVGNVAPVSDAFRTPIRARLSPPRDVQLNGRPILKNNTVPTTGTTPVLTWEAPSLGTARHYDIHLVRISDTTFETVARFVVRERKLAVPPDILTLGEQYLFRIRAMDVNTDSYKLPFALNLPFSYADAVTAVFTP
jgi:hypothetical protein